MIAIQVRGLVEALARLDGLAPRVHQELRAEVERQTIALQTHIQTSKLSGQVLRTRTGTLRRSITFRIEETPGGIRGIVGTHVPYARIHEYGGTIMVPEIRPRHKSALHFVVGGVEVFAMRTRAHPVKIPARSYLRSALAERRDQILAGLRRAIAAAVQP